MLTKYEKLALKNNFIYNNFLFLNHLFTINLFKELVKINKLNKTKYYIHKILHQDIEYVKGIYPYNYLYKKLDKKEKIYDSEFYDKLSYCDDISINLIENTIKSKWNYYIILNNQNVKDEVIEYIFKEKILVIENHNIINISNRNIIYNRNMPSITYSYIKNEYSNLLPLYLSQSGNITDEILDEVLKDYKNIIYIIYNHMIDINTIIKRIKSHEKINVYEIIENLVDRSDFSFDMFEDFYDYYKLDRNGYYIFLYIKLLETYRHRTIDDYIKLYSSKDILKKYEIFEYMISNIQYIKNIEDYLFDERYRSKIIKIYGYYIFSHKDITEENILYILNNYKYEFEDIEEDELYNISSIIYTNNKNISFKFIKENIYIDFYIDESNNFYIDESNKDSEYNNMINKFYNYSYIDDLKCSYNKCMKELYKGIHKMKFNHKINEELISKTCSPKRMYNWNEYACEEYPDEYNKECEKYRIM